MKKLSNYARSKMADVKIMRNILGYGKELYPDFTKAVGQPAVAASMVASTIKTTHPFSREEGLHRVERDAIQDAREDIASLQTPINMVFPRDMPDFLKNVIGVIDPIDIPLRVAEKDKDDQFVVSDESLLNLLQWHGENVDNVSMAFEAVDWPVAKQRFYTRVQELVAKGVFPKEALSAHKLAELNLAKVQVTDGEYLERSGALANTSFAHWAPVVRLAPHFSGHNISHELTHVIVGRDVSFGGYNLAKSGLRRLFPESQVVAARAINEAVTEVIAQIIEGKNADETISPFSNDGSYLLERGLIRAIYASGLEPVPIKLFIDAYFEDSSKLRRPAFKALKKALSKAYPDRNILDDLGKALLGKNENEESGVIIRFAQELNYCALERYRRQ